jgi:hypothetical protein
VSWKSSIRALVSSLVYRICGPDSGLPADKPIPAMPGTSLPLARHKPATSGP